MRGFILTYCPSPEVLYGNVLTAKTLRVGFPTTPIYVFDNASAPELRPQIEKAYRDVGCAYYQIDKRITHTGFLLNILQHSFHEPVMFLDPDLVFWGNMEDCNFNQLMHGRRIPDFYDPYTKCNTVARLHTSLLIFPKLKELRECLEAGEKDKFEFEAVCPTMRELNKKWYRWDTMASMYQFLGDKAVAFSEKELALYDHIFCGTNFPHVQKHLNNIEFEGRHLAAAENRLSDLRGMHTEQDKFFNSNPWI